MRLLCASNPGHQGRAFDLPYDPLRKVSNQMIDGIDGISRVANDTPGKPPATAESERPGACRWPTKACKKWL
ncbi:MAG: hypothetical protein AAF756_22925 [Pseudomonadota bacterium]